MEHMPSSETEGDLRTVTGQYAEHMPGYERERGEGEEGGGERGRGVTNCKWTACGTHAIV